MISGESSADMDAMSYLRSEGDYLDLSYQGRNNILPL